MFKIIRQLTNSKEMLNSLNIHNELIEIDETLRIKLQFVILDMFKDVYNICKKNNIELVLVGGSALGAVRHQGFIPWDDDLDIGMTRENYNKFKKIFKDELGEKYVLCAPNYSKNAKTRFPKILKKGTVMQEVIDSSDTDLQKIFLDIFILDNAPNNKIYRMFKGIYCNFLEFVSGVVFFYENADEITKKIYTLNGTSNYKIRMLLGKVFSFMNSAKWNDIVDRAIQYNKNSNSITIATGRKHYFGEILEKKELFPLQEGLFEDLKVPLFKNNDYYLKNLYGDYMSIPPIEKREKHFIRNILLKEEEINE